MNVEKEGDYVDLSTDKTPHYGVVTRVIDSNSFETIECNIFGAPCKTIAMTRRKSDERGIVGIYVPYKK